jgi:arsenate reductase (glutaredoxin)
MIIPDKPSLKIQRTMTDITIFHNPQCSSSRKALALIRETGEEPTVLEYLKTPPSSDEILSLVQRMGGSVRDVLRQKGTPYDELDLGNPQWTDAQLLDFIAQHPILIQRPIVATPMGLRVCRSAEVVLDILPKAL